MNLQVAAALLVGSGGGADGGGAGCGAAGAGGVERGAGRLPAGRGAGAAGAGAAAAPARRRSAGSRLTSLIRVAAGPTGGATAVPTVTRSASGLPVFSTGAVAVAGTV